MLAGRRTDTEGIKMKRSHYERLKLGFTLTELSTRAGLPVAEIDRIERGGSATDDQADKLARVLRVSAAEIGDELDMFTGKRL